MTAPQISEHALTVASELCEWDRLMWAVLWDTQPEQESRRRHLCSHAMDDGTWLHQPALFFTRREATAYIKSRFAYCYEAQHRRPPANNRPPRPYRVRVRITVPAPPAKTDDDAFLTRILAAAQASEPVTAEDVARLRQLADWADAAPPPHWDGRMDRHETARAVDAARKRMARDG